MHAPTTRAAAVLATTLALWGTAQGTTLPTERVHMNGQRVVGSALFRYWGFEIYQATLYAPAGFEPARYEQQRFSLELQYRRDFRGTDIAQRSIDEMQAIAPLSDTQSRDWLDAMRGAFPDVKAGDRLTGVHEPGSGAHFYLNGRLHATVDDPVFAARFFGIWLSPRTSAPGLRAALIGSAAR